MDSSTRRRLALLAGLMALACPPNSIAQAQTRQAPEASRRRSLLEFLPPRPPNPIAQAPTRQVPEASRRGSLLESLPPLPRHGETPSPRPVAGEQASKPRAVPSDVVRASFEAKATGATIPRPKATASYEGTVSPGLQVVLKSDGTVGPNLKFQWIQTQGPPAELLDATGPRARFIVPNSTGTLGFRLIVANEGGIDAAAVQIPVLGGDASGQGANLRPDAGDDQIGRVGRQVTLNGMRSEPKGRVGFRWVQVAGPSVTLRLQDGYMFTFVPQAPGQYRFALLIGSGNVISEPDFVDVTVAGASEAGQAPGALSGRAGSQGETALAPTIERIVVPGVVALGCDRRATEEFSKAFALTSERASLYATYGELFLETSRRLEPWLPVDSAARSQWIDRLFVPLTSRIVEEMLREGLDLRGAQAQSATLTPSQKARLGVLFREFAEAFRAASEPKADGIVESQHPGVAPAETPNGTRGW